MDVDKRPKHLAQLQVRRAPKYEKSRSFGRPNIFFLFTSLTTFPFCSQALAAIGQCRLMSLWDSLFGHLSQPIAQILLTRNDIADVCFLTPFALFVTSSEVLCCLGELQ